MLSQEQIDIVRSTVPLLEKYGNTVTDVLYRNLLPDYPPLKEVFNQGNQANGHQAKALAGAVYAYAANIDNLGALAPTVEHITHKHASLFIQPQQYDLVGQYLLDAFGQVLGDAFTPAIRGAWAAAYKQLADILISAEKKLHNDAGSWTTWRDFAIQRKIPESTEITSFVLAPVDKQPLPSYCPGQYLSIRVHVPRLQMYQARQYSLSDKPNPDYYRISVKSEAGIDTRDPQVPAYPGYVSNALHDEKRVGDIVQLSRPLGDFFFDPERPQQAAVVLLSAGVGLTPLVAMLNTVLGSENSSRLVTWIHGARSTSAQAFTNHIRGLEEINPNLRTVTFIKNPSDDDRPGFNYQHAGRVDLKKCDPERDLFLSNGSTEYYVCGPPSFMTDVRQELLSRGVHPVRIKMERFGTGAVEASL